ncbi:MAG TPA: recombinase zinc beta ribbon domain-containing protein [Chloroflexia bacterium]|nr:recombinase zinc beta ribbon domain-containing protein [Chloroflexia bacterium]
MKLSQNQSFATRNNKSHQYLLRALVSCGVCNNACLGCTRGKNSYYACRAKGRIEISRIEEKCRSRYIPAGQLDELVWQDLCEVIQNPELTKVALQRALGGKWLPQELQARKENLRKVGTTLANQLERLTAAYLVGVIELEEYKRRRQEVEQRQRSLEEQAKQLEVSVKRRVELEGIARSIEEFCERVREGLAKADFEQKRRLVELLIDRVVVRNEEVEIRYVVPTSARSEHLHFYQLVTDYFRSIIVRKYYCGGLYNAIAANLCQENLSQCFQLIQKKFIALTKPAGFSALIANVKDLIRPRSELLAENALLRQQLIVLQRQVKRPAFKPHDKFLLVLLASLVKPWRKALLILQPDTLLRWDRQAFKLLWTFKSKPKKRKARISQQTIALIRQMAQENPLWGAEPIHGELLKLNIQVSKQPSESI